MDNDSPARNLRSRKSKGSALATRIEPLPLSKDETEKSSRKGYKWYQRQWLRTLNYEELPNYLKDNDFIRTGYRSDYSYHEAFISLFHLHNESVNIWTHLLGVLLCLVLVAYNWYSTELSMLHAEDKVVLSIFLLLHCYTLLFSSLLHLNLCVSEDAQRFWSCLDHSGISASIGAGSISLMYILLHCHGNVRILWVSLLFLFNTVGVIGPLFPVWRTPAFRIKRSLIYVFSGCATFLPVFYYIFHEGTEKLPMNLDENFALGNVVSMAFQYLLGAFLYAFRIPERFAPGRFDYFFQSHNLWHVLVVSGSVTLWRAVIGLVKWKMFQTAC